MIYSTAAMVAATNPCDDGAVRTRQALERYGWDYDAILTAKWCLKECNLHDTIYSIGTVFPESKDEADWVLREFGKYLLKCMNDTALAVDSESPRIPWDVVAEASRLATIYLDKHKDKASLMALISKQLAHPAHLTDAYKSFLQHGKPLHLRVLHASIELAKYRAFNNEEPTAAYLAELDAQTKRFKELLDEADDAFRGK